DRRAEELERLRLRRRREGEEGEVARPAAPLERAREQVLRVTAASLLGGVLALGLLKPLLRRAAREDAAQVGGCLARLRGVRLVDDHGISPRRQLPHLLEHERELLQ